MSEMTKEEVEFLLDKLIGIKNIQKIENDEENSLTVTIVTEWETTDDNNETVIYDDEEVVYMTSDRIKIDGSQLDYENINDYKKYMIAKGYSEYWLDNPYI